MSQKLNSSSSAFAPKKSLTAVKKLVKGARYYDGTILPVCCSNTLGQKKDGPQIDVVVKNCEHLPSERSQIEIIKPNWSELPEDIIEEILNKIDMCGDYLSFSAISTVWCSISQGINSRSPYKLPRYHFLPKKNSIPMLLQPGGEEGGDMHYLYSTTEQKIYSGLHIPELNNKWIPGSANGWLVTIDISDLQINLLNPLTRVLISLPASSTFQKPYSPLFNDGSSLNFVKRVYISSNPIDDNANCLCVAMVSCKRTLSLCKIGDYNWTKLEPSIFGINDVIMYKGLLYAMNWEGKLFAIEVGPNKKVTVLAKLEFSLGRPQYLVESSRNLLLVVRMRECIGPTVHIKTGVGNNTIPIRHYIKTIGFKVYKLVQTQSTDTDSHEHFKTEDDAIHYQDEPIRCVWEEIETLDGMTLFIGHNQCSSLDPNLYPGSKENCIYFADGNLEHDSIRLQGGVNCPHDISFYDMKSQEIKLFPGLSESSSRMSSIWFSPNF